MSWPKQRERIRFMLGPLGGIIFIGMSFINRYDRNDICGRSSSSVGYTPPSICFGKATIPSAILNVVNKLSGKHIWSREKWVDWPVPEKHNLAWIIGKNLSVRALVDSVFPGPHSHRFWPVKAEVWSGLFLMGTGPSLEILCGIDLGQKRESQGHTSCICWRIAMCIKRSPFRSTCSAYWMRRSLLSLSFTSVLDLALWETRIWSFVNELKSTTITMRWDKRWIAPITSFWRPSSIL